MSKTSLKNLIIFCAALLASLGVSSAQVARKVAFRTLCLGHVDGMESVLIPGGSDEVQKVELFTDVSQVVEGVFKTGEALFYIEKPPGPDGKVIRELVGKAPLGKSGHQLFLFSPGEAGEGKLPYSVRIFDDDTTSFPMGSVRVINLAPMPVRFLLSGETTPQVPPTRYAQFPHSKKVNDFNMYPVVVQFLGGNGDWINGQSVSWKSTDRRRDIVITSVDLRLKQPTVSMYSDFPPWMEASLIPPTR